MILEVQKFLYTNNLQALEEKYAINYRRHKRYNNLVCLKYNQFESPMSLRISQECRGLILDEHKNWDIISRPFDKFFNYGEYYASQIDWNSAFVLEKLDGSLMTIYFYDNKWHVQSSGTPDAGGNINPNLLEWRENNQLIMPFPKTFADYFWQISNYTNLGITPNMKHVPEDYCFMFEMMGPLNRVVVKHNKSKLVLIGARNIKTGKELLPNDAAKLLPQNVEVVQNYSLNNIDEIISTFNNMNPIEQEGYVILDSNFNRVKVKCPAYVALHHAKGEDVTPKRLLSIAVCGESDEWVSYFDEYKEELYNIRKKLDSFISEIEHDYETITAKVGSGSQKDFALLATQTKCPSALFAFRAGKCDSIKSFIRQIDVNKLVKLIYQ